MFEFQKCVKNVRDRARALYIQRSEGNFEMQLNRLRNKAGDSKYDILVNVPL